MAYQTQDISSRRVDAHWEQHFPFHSKYYQATCAEHLAGVLITEQEITNALFRVGTELLRNYRSEGIEDIILLAIPEGGITLSAILPKFLKKGNDVPTGIAITPGRIQISRYGLDHTPLEPYLSEHPTVDIRDRHVLVGEDLIDEGRTVDYGIEKLVEMGAKSITVVTAVVKDNLQCEINRERVSSTGTIVPVNILSLFKTANHWLGGFGMDIVVLDAEGKKRPEYRQLPFIVVAQPNYLERTGQAPPSATEALRRLLL